MWSYTEEQSIRNSYVINIILKLISKFQLINFFLFLHEYRKYLLPLQHKRKKKKKKKNTGRWFEKRKSTEGGKLNRGEGVNLDYTPGQVLFPRMHDFTILVREDGGGERKGRTRGTSFHFYSTDRSDLRPCERSIHTGRRRDMKKKRTT